MKRKFYLALLGSLVLAVLLLLSFNVRRVSANALFEIAPIGSTPYGHSYSEWAARWWQWGLEAPTSVNPLIDTIGQNCATNQSGSVWFLGGSFSPSPITRACIVPSNTALFYPLINIAYFAFLSDPPEQRTEDFVRSQVACIEDATFSTVKIDGAAVGNPKQYLEKSVLFDVILPKDNIFGAKNNVIPKLTLSPSVDEGYYLFVLPLASGEHTLQWKASSTACGFSQDITYNVTVK